MVCRDKAPKSFDIILKTKDNDTRVIRASGSKIIGSNNDCLGSLFMGKDITEDVTLHKKLVPGNSYLITDKEQLSSFNLISELTFDEFNGLIITRGNPEYIRNQIDVTDNLKIVLLTKKIIPKLESLSDLKAVETKLKEFTKKQRKPVILFDGIHYLLSRFSFDSFIRLLYDINDLIVERKAILFIRIDPSTIQNHELALLENELVLLPDQKTEDIIIRDSLYDLVNFIYKQNQDNSVVSVKKVMNEFAVTYVTAASRINTLEEKGLIFSKKQGKIRAIFVTDRGKRLIHKRMTV